MTRPKIDSDQATRLPALDEGTPAQPRPTLVDPAARSGPIALAATRAHAPRVLIIDDSEVSRISITNTLTAVGCQVFQLASAIGATRLILRHHVRAAIIDVNMPGLSGDKLVAVLRNNSRLRELVIVVVSGCRELELEAIREATGADGALQKSRIATDLWPLLTRLLAEGLEHRAR